LHIILFAGRENSMPFINGRFYANPAYGRALERARRASSGGIWSEDFPEQTQGTGGEVSHRRDALQAASRSVRAGRRKHQGNDDYDAATTAAGITNQIYNETASLRPTCESGMGSDTDRQDARLAMARIIHNRAAAKRRGGLASAELHPKEAAAVKRFPSSAYDAFGGSRHVASVAGGPRDPTGGAQFFYLDHGQPEPPWSIGKEPVVVYGPFRNTVSQKRRHKGDSTETIKIYE
jgi:hypothetical protein